MINVTLVQFENKHMQSQLKKNMEEVIPMKKDKEKNKKMDDR